MKQPTTITPQPTANANYATRIYQLVGLLALGLVGLILADESQGSPLIFIVLLPGFLGLLFSIEAAPFLFLVFLVLFTSTPLPWLRTIWLTIPPSRMHFISETLLIVSASLAYLIAQFRLNSLRKQWMPSDVSSFENNTGKITRRLGSSYKPEEVYRAGILIVGLVFVASLLWMLATQLIVLPLEVPPLGQNSQNIVSSQSRFLILVGFLVLIGGVLSAILAITSWNKLGREEARQYLLDVAWLENRRELNRHATRRAWVRGKLAKLQSNSVSDGQDNSTESKLTRIAKRVFRWIVILSFAALVLAGILNAGLELLQNWK